MEELDNSKQTVKWLKVIAGAVVYMAIADSVILVAELSYTGIIHL